MGLSFLNGGLLGALSLIGIPILIHLLQRRRFRVVRWGAMEFLRLSQRNRSRRLMIEQLILLAIRCLVIALVVLAICRPVIRAGALPMAVARGQVHAILIVDDSYSMGYRPAGAGSETVFDRALKRALELVERGLRQGDAVSVVLASEPPRALIRKASLDLKAVAGRLRTLRLSDAGTNYGKAARLAAEVAGESAFVNREVFLVGDNQAAGWEGRGKDGGAWEALAKLARVVLLPVREGPAANAAVEWVQAARGLSTVRASTRIQARLVNKGPQALRSLAATLEVDGKAQGSSQSVDLEPGQGALIAFNQIFDRPGVRACTVRLTPDRLTADDAGYLALRVRQNVRVLVVNGKPDSAVPQHDAGFFLNLALSPPITQPGAEPTALEPRVVTGAGYGGADVRQFDVVTLSNVAAVGESERRLLAEFVQNGGGALIFLGDRVNPDLYNRDLLNATPSLLPAALGPIGTTKTALDAATLDHPALQRFRGAADVDLGSAQFSRHFQLTPRDGDKTVRVMARFTDGAPAMVEKQFGLGRVILVASGATTEWNTLPVKPAFLPLIHQLVAYLAGGSDGTRNGTVGESLVKPIPLAESGRKAVIVAPSGADTAVKPLVDDRGATITLEAPRQAGFFRLRVDHGTQDLFAVNRDVAESDLRSLGRESLKKALAGIEWTWIGLNEDLVGALTRARQGVELWRHLLLAALVLMVAETMLAQLFGRRA